MCCREHSLALGFRKEREVKGRQGQPARQREQLVQRLSGAKEHATSPKTEKTSILGQTSKEEEKKIENKARPGR